ncbi:LolA-related protein [Telmatospirillum sp.]|uniref:LolA-related protein n=1 Tax=Telmatospirillum sp. TaxID=2079197 RepID=UPI0028523F14|nr:LolA-related protein [Telmatospirillum sp.]MDR3439086.1 hypothetical protein [Telmatospirillum sp.]
MIRVLARFCALLWLCPLCCLAAGPQGSLAAGQVLRGHFVQERHMTGFNAPLKTEGHLVLSAGKGLIWRAEKPFAVTTVITADGLTQASGGTETTRLPAAKLPFLSHLYDMLGGALTGDWHALESDFSIATTGTDKAWQVVLTPRQDQSPIAMRIRTITVTGSKFVDHVTIAKPDGDADDLSFIDQTLSDGPPAADEAAAFDSLAR